MKFNSYLKSLATLGIASFLTLDLYAQEKNPKPEPVQRTYAPGQTQELVKCPEHKPGDTDWRGRPIPYNLWPDEFLPEECRQNVVNVIKKEEKTRIQTRHHLDVGWTGFDQYYGHQVVGIVGYHTTVAEIKRLNISLPGLMVIMGPYQDKTGTIKRVIDPAVEWPVTYRLGHWGFIDKNAYINIAFGFNMPETDMHVQLGLSFSK